MRRRGLLAAAALVVVANAIALLGVARNRASATVTIDLTQRELTLEGQGEENSGIDLRLATQYGSSMDWLDAAKLHELGFPTAVLSSGKFRDWPARPAYVAFEYDGPAWQAVVEQERKRPGFAAAYLERQSHLVAVDASRDPNRLMAALLAKYGNAGGRLILRATVKPLVGGQFVAINPQIHVPLPAALDLERFARPYPQVSESPRYTVRLAYGAHFEPWIISVTAIAK